MPSTINLQALEFQGLDHFGLVASVIDKFKVVEQFDKQLPISKEKGAIVSHGQRIKAMIINGLGFTANPLYLSPEFFEGKALSCLIGKDIMAEHLNDDALGRTLDAIYAAGSTRLFADVAFHIASRHQLFGRSAKLDSTSLKLFGHGYDVDEESTVARPTLGFSKDHRPDLKQLVMSLIVSGKGNIPLWFEGIDGNSQDKKSFHETIERVRCFQEQLQKSPSFLWVADSALYSEGKLSKSPVRYLTRVPATLKKVKVYYQKDKLDFVWEDLGNGYKSSWVSSNHPERERWLLIHSAQAEKRETATLLRRLDKALIQAKSAAKKLKSNHFSCEIDACKAAKKLDKTLKYHRAVSTITPIYSHNKPGRPKLNETPEITHYQVTLTIEEEPIKCQPYYQQAGRFVLASNELGNRLLSANEMLKTYKEQQGVEQGFRFIKDPCFHLNQVFLKKPERIEALMMIMTLCLMIYNLGQHLMREQLQQQNKTLPNQKGKEINNPTLRWVFQMMKAINVVYYPGQAPAVLGLNDKKRRIIELFGWHAAEVYGLK